MTSYGKIDFGLIILTHSNIGAKGLDEGQRQGRLGVGKLIERAKANPVLL